jgi:bla regulator protein blaR1
MRTSSIFAAVALVAIVAAAQTPAPRPLGEVFEVASIKLNRDGGPISGLRRLPGGRFEVTNMPLAFLIAFAYQLQPFELQGGPSWMESDRWDVIAKIAGDPPRTAPDTPDAMMMATRALLAERFKLVVRKDTREIDVYLLVRTNADGRLGPGLQQSATDCQAVQKAADEAGKGGPPAPSPNTPDRMICGMHVSVGRVQFGGRPLSTFTNVLTTLTQRRIVDRTGLVGDWQFDISFAPPPPALPGPEPPTPDPDAPSLFTVLQERLGLKLQAARIPMPVMVVDHAERPVQD